MRTRGWRQDAVFSTPLAPQRPWDRFRRVAFSVMWSSTTTTQERSDPPEQTSQLQAPTCNACIAYEPLLLDESPPPYSSPHLRTAQCEARLARQTIRCCTKGEPLSINNHNYHTMEVSSMPKSPDIRAGSCRHHHIVARMLAECIDTSQLNELDSLP